MDYRALLSIPLAALALSASSAETLRQPAGWLSGASHPWPPGTTHEMGVAAETENGGQRALTIKALGERKAYEIGSISQPLWGYAARRIRFSAQVKATGVDGWAGLAVASGGVPLFVAPNSPEAGADATAPRGAAGCTEWCEVSVVADVPAAGDGMATVGLALIGNGQVWARGFKLEIVGPEVPVTAHRFGAEAAALIKADSEWSEWQMRNRNPTPPQNLSLQ
ncbi:MULTISPECIES: hypothetical protein [unclassified Roseateles]|uniref:hypothetical protein n=1 Tax=unclassified Roseateles TaxID=2626991 RepID=UPI0006FFDF78|nr:MULTISPECIES: hypothetical protein [unclassified Roseateles]KQW52254.1 hypothetical protein ASC81_06640 [Pelomonas sp. Root405]KRA78488.1 hypothetical protein ASD88_06645 [Pelomonas sp. Root662]